MSTPIQPVPDLALAPEFPSLADRPAGLWNQKAKDWADGENGMATRTREIATTAHNNAVAATEQAVIATTKAGEAAGSAQAAADSESAAQGYAENLASLDALWLGAATSDPTAGKGGAPLVAGNAYVNSITGYVRAYNGSEWVQGISAVAGVSALNGQAGALALKTIRGQSLLGAGEVETLPSLIGNEGKALVVQPGTNPGDPPVAGWGDPVAVGDIRFSIDQPGPGFIRTGQRYLQSAYPELFARIGIRPSFPKTTAAGTPTTMADCERGYYLDGQFFQNSSSGNFYRWNPSTSLWETLAIPSSPVRRWLAVGGGFAVAGAAPPTAWSRATGAITSATTWTNITGPGTNVPLHSLLFHNGEFFAFKDDGVFASTNGTAWSARTTVPGGVTISKVVSFQGKLLALVNGGGLWVSGDNAVTWSAVTLPSSVPVSAVFAVDGEIVATSPYSTGCAYSTEDLVTWRTFPIGRWSRTYGIFGAAPGCVIGIGDASNKTLEFSFQDGMVFEVKGSWPGTVSYQIISTDDGTPPMLTSYDSANGRMYTQFIQLHDYDKATQFFVPPVITLTGMQSWIKAE